MRSTVSLSVLGFLCVCAPFSQADQLNVLGTASNFAVLGASTVTNTGSTVLGGDLGVSPGTSITGFPPGSFSGSAQQFGGAVSAQGETDAKAGYNFLTSLQSTGNLTGKNLGGLTLTPGVFSFSSSAGLTGPLTLDFGGLNNASFIFQIGSTLTTASGSVVDVIGEGSNDSIYWAVGSSATLGTMSAFEGSLIANQSITLTTGASITCGNAIALNGAVTLDTNAVGGNCDAGFTNPPPTAVPEPGTINLLITGALGAAGVVRRRLAA